MNTTTATRFIRRLFPKVTLVRDARKHVEVSVNNADCGKGALKNDPAECAMARAVRRQFKADGAAIGIGSSYIIKGNVATRYTTPPSLSREIVSFDRHSDFAPGVYRLSPVSPSRRLGRQRPGEREGKKTGERRMNRITHVGTVRVRTWR